MKQLKVARGKRWGGWCGLGVEGAAWRVRRMVIRRIRRRVGGCMARLFLLKYAVGMTGALGALLEGSLTVD